MHPKVLTSRLPQTHISGIVITGVPIHASLTAL
jgi:hypothetical protein